MQIFIVFQPVLRYFKKLANNNHISAWKSEGLSDESIKSSVSNSTLAPALNYINTKIPVEFDVSCLKQEKVTLKHKQVVNIFIVYKIGSWPSTVGQYFMLGNSFLKLLNKNTTDFDKF